MYRTIYDKLIEWKENCHRKPLIFEGARQVGKTWILKEFGKNEYANYVYINCDNNSQVSALFYDFDVMRIIRSFSAISGEQIIPNNTLIILDEIQEIPLALTSLKYFAENAPEYHIIVAGSLLGIKLHEGTGFPVGKVNSMNLYPMSFSEFLLANGKDVLLDHIKEHRFKEMNDVLPQLIELLRQYYYTGGMPAVVDCYVKSGNLKEVRALQKSILSDYERDFSKHAPADDLPKIYSVWNSIPSQLAKENKKFIYGQIKKGARAKDYENAIVWLENAGLVYRITKVNKLEKPLKFYECRDSFKLFMLDVGLLGAMVDASPADVLIGNNAFSCYKGSFTEQYVATQFKAAVESNIYYYANENSTLELDFVIEAGNVYPIEVKAETNLRAKSLSNVLSKDERLHGIRFSMSPYIEQEKMRNVPLPLTEEYFRFLFEN